MEIDQDTCLICGGYMDIVSIMFTRKPFVDGKKYHHMCYCCASVPDSNGKIKSVQDIVNYGWNKQEAKKSISAVKKL